MEIPSGGGAQADMRSGRKRAASGRSESCEKGASGRPPLNRGAEQTSAPVQDQLTVLPPSTLRIWLVMYEASSEAMKTIALASSSERPRRPIGTVVIRDALFSGVPVNRVNMSVSVGPGATRLTRIPDLSFSSATDLLMPSTACLLPT